MRAAARIRLGDRKASYLWADEELDAFANDAQNEACRRARLLIDSSTEEITLISLSAGEATYPLDPRILFLRRVKMTGVSQKLRPVSYKDLDTHQPDWQDETGEPRHYVPDMDTDLFRPYPTPEVAGTVRLTVVRLPLAPMVDDGDVPEVKPHLHESLLDWVCHRAYSKQDADTQDDEKAAIYLARFELEFGKKSSAVDEEWINREHGFTPEEGVF